MEFARIAEATLPGEIFEPTSLRRSDSKRIWLSTRSRSTRQTICGFQWIASKMPRAAEGVITS